MWESLSSHIRLPTFSEKNTGFLHVQSEVIDFCILYFLYLKIQYVYFILNSFSYPSYRSPPPDILMTLKVYLRVCIITMGVLKKKKKINSILGREGINSETYILK